MWLNISHGVTSERTDQQMGSASCKCNTLMLIHVSTRTRTRALLTLTVLNLWNFTSYCSLKPLWSGMGEVVPARTSPTLHPPSPPTVHQLSWLVLQELIITQKLHSIPYRTVNHWNSVFNSSICTVSLLSGTKFSLRMSSAYIIKNSSIPIILHYHLYVTYL